VAAGSGSAPEGLLPRRESLWLGEGWINEIWFPLPFIPPCGRHPLPPREGMFFRLFSRQERCKECIEN